MFCPKCGKEVADGQAFCGNCGAAVGEKKAANAGASAAGSTGAAGAAVTGTPNATGAAAAAVKKSGGKKGIIIGAVVVVVVAVIALFATGVLGGSGVAVKGSTNDYTWEELSKISNEIAKASDENGAVEVAKKYNLTTPEGKLDGTQTKSVTLSNGTTVDVQICGFAHDSKTDGGKAGITFIFKDCIAEHNMNSTDTNAGGWQNSQMRSWLASEGMNMLPEDLKSKIVAVDKMTNNTGQTQSASSVTKTSDSLWLFSFTELAGKVSPNDFSSSYAYLVDIYNAEGTEYKLFRDMNVVYNSSNGVLVKYFNGSSDLWWERSPFPYGSDIFQSVYDGGYPYGAYGAGLSYGVVPGFCI